MVETASPVAVKTSRPAAGWMKVRARGCGPAASWRAHRSPNSSRLNTSGYQLRREFSRTEGSSRGTHGVICDQGPESRWVRSLKSAWRITAPPRLPRPCDGSAGVGKNPVTRGPFGSPALVSRLGRGCGGLDWLGRPVCGPSGSGLGSSSSQALSSASRWMTSLRVWPVAVAHQSSRIWATMACTMVSRLRSYSGSALMMPVPRGPVRAENLVHVMRPGDIR
jgi:hypothetical protein